MKTAAAYIRVSTDGQLEYSPDSQLKIIQDYAQRNGFSLPEQYIFREEEGISGKKAEKRPAFMQMIGIAKQKPKPFDCIILWKFSRFARNRRDSIVYKSMLRKQLGIDVVSVTEQLGDDKLSMLMEAIIEAMDEYYSINLAEEVKRGMQEKVSRGEPVTPPAFGYMIREKAYLPDPETAPVVQSIFHRFNGGASFREIAQYLNALGIRTTKGNLWESRAIRYILHNPVYAGKIQWHTDGTAGRGSDMPALLTDGRHEALISPEIWTQVQNRLHQFQTKQWKRTKTTEPTILSGLVRCSNCGARLVKSSHSSFQCRAYAHGICNVSHCISIQKLESMVLAVCCTDLYTCSISLNLSDRSKDQKFLQVQLEREQQRLDRLRCAYESGVETLEEYQEEKQRLSSQIALLQEKCYLSLSFHSEETYTLPSLLLNPDISPLGKNRLLGAFIKYIVFDSKNQHLEIHYQA
ncbi:recombinase family protein [Clostridium sp. D33t1_170424_F3]|uniref:recombinase family protein n=1 Tax=Clostridium sp. D33t1_170424_F3 TaxID=2787099 RepID=UPI0018AB35F5|nr:recombinase family protein [Clostridium sp. D33t1_170424_F3]